MYKLFGLLKIYILYFGSIVSDESQSSQVNAVNYCENKKGSGRNRRQREEEEEEEEEEVCEVEVWV